jgi:hypothetical protein
MCEPLAEAIFRRFSTAWPVGQIEPKRLDTAFIRTTTHVPALAIGDLQVG